MQGLSSVGHRLNHHCVASFGDRQWLKRRLLKWKASRWYVQTTERKNASLMWKNILDVRAWCLRNVNSPQCSVLKCVISKVSAAQMWPAVSNTVTEALKQTTQEKAVLFDLCSPSVWLVLYHPLDDDTGLLPQYRLRYACGVCTAGLWICRAQDGRFHLHSHAWIGNVSGLRICLSGKRLAKDTAPADSI